MSTRGWLVGIAIVVACWAPRAGADTGGSVGGGNWQRQQPAASSSSSSRGSSPTTTTTPSLTSSATADHITALSTAISHPPSTDSIRMPPIGVLVMIGIAIVGGLAWWGISSLMGRRNDVANDLNNAEHERETEAKIAAMIARENAKPRGDKPQPSTARPASFEPPSASPAATADDLVDLGVLRVALDGRARPFVQTSLARIAKLADTATDAGRFTVLRETVLMLRRLHDAWIYGGAVNAERLDLDATKANFDQHVDDARAKFMDELVRNDQGVITTADAAPAAHVDAGPGVVLVTIVVAARKELPTITAIGDGAELLAALESLPRHERDLVAVEIVWQPADPDDRLSSIALEAKYPRPALIPITGALVGKTFCAYCGSPFAAELVACPHCGAPAIAQPAPPPADT